jgi:hypothetical protein
MSSSFCPKGQNKVKEKLSISFFLALWQLKISFKKLYKADF